MHRLAGVNPHRILQSLEPVRLGARVMEATATACAALVRPGSERAAEDPLGARE